MSSESGPVLPSVPKMVDADTAGWKFAQCFGDREGEIEQVTEADNISTVEFDYSGDYLATGDKGGRVVLFERNEAKRGCEYKFYTEFQSHEPEFDYLKSLEIEEKINKIRWCKRQNSSHFLLSTNDKTIKLWKVYEKSLKVVAENNMSAATEANGGIVPPIMANVSLPGLGPSSSPGPSRLNLPRMVYHDTIVATAPRKVYQNAHTYHVNSISVNSDQETFISADDLRINLWNFEHSDRSFNILDIKPANMEELTEVITAAEFHPQSCNLFCYSSSKGIIKLADMRHSALCDRNAKVFEEAEDLGNKSFFSEIIASVSDVKFSQDGRYMLSRDYLSLRVWDIRNDSRPLKVISVYEPLRGKLCELYENDCIFDKFECNFNGSGSHMLSGSYNNYFHIFDTNATTDVVLQADKNAFRAKKMAAQAPTPSKKGTPQSKQTTYVKPSPINIDVDQMNFNKKILHASWHPNEDIIAIAATNNLFLYSKTKGA